VNKKIAEMVSFPQISTINFWKNKDFRKPKQNILPRKRKLKNLLRPGSPWKTSSEDCISFCNI
jgi:hypothetical protein